MNGVLEGIHVVELSQIIAAPVAGQILADLGADVLKIEPPGGESWRLQAPIAPTESKSYQCLNRGKHNLTLDLTRPEATRIVHRLVEDADVVLINYRPDVPARFGIDWATLSRVNPALVYVDLTAFGRRGPSALRPGYDGIVQAVSGLMAGEGKLRPDGAPAAIASAAIADFATGMVLAQAVVTALYHRECTGEGQLVECSLLATALWLQSAEVTTPATSPSQLAPEGATYAELVQRRAAAAPAVDAHRRVYLTSDGAIVIAVDSADQRRAAAALVGTTEEAIAARMMGGTNDEWLERLAATAIPAAPVLFPEDLSGHQQFAANDWFVTLEHEVTGTQSQVGPLLRCSAVDAPPPRPAPPLGRDTDAVLRALGYRDDEIAHLAERGVIGER